MPIVKWTLGLAEPVVQHGIARPQPRDVHAERPAGRVRAPRRHGVAAPPSPVGRTRRTGCRSRPRGPARRFRARDRCRPRGCRPCLHGHATVPSSATGSATGAAAWFRDDAADARQQVNRRRRRPHVVGGISVSGRIVAHHRFEPTRGATAREVRRADRGPRAATCCSDPVRNRGQAGMERLDRTRDRGPSSVPAAGVGPHTAETAGTDPARAAVVVRGRRLPSRLRTRQRPTPYRHKQRQNRQPCGREFFGLPRIASFCMCH